MSDGRDLDQRVAGLEADVQNLSRNMAQLTGAVQGLSEKLSATSKIDFGAMAAWAAIIMSVLSSFGYLSKTGMDARMDYLTSEIRSNHHEETYELEKLEKRFHDHENKGGHRELTIRMQALEKQVDRIDNEQSKRTHKVWSK